MIKNAIGRVLVLSLAGAVVLLGACDDDGGSQRPAEATGTATTGPGATQTGTPASTATPTASITFAFSRPEERQLSLAGPISVRLSVPAGVEPQSLSVTLDGEPVTAELSVAGAEAASTLAGVAAGQHLLVAEAQRGADTLHAEVSFETVSLENPAECEILNNAACLLPYPSARFLEAAPTPTGWRLRFPAAGMPRQFDTPLSPAPYSTLDGFNPTVQILMHFPGGVDPERSNASRLRAETRTYTLRSLDADSPTVLLDADTGERILHFVETDARAEDDPSRQVLFLRPGKSLFPGHRHIVAVRDLMHPDGTPVKAEAVFAALRDSRPTDIDAITTRRAHFEDIFSRLADAGVARANLLLAFDFVVQSDAGLTSQMLSMRDQAFAWLAEQASQGGETFAVERVAEHDCSAAGTRLWRQVEGTFQVPLFLVSDPVADRAAPGMLNVDKDGMPVMNGLTTPPFTIGIPCSALAAGGTPKRAIVLGHGLLGTGRDTITGLLSAPELGELDLVTGATDWWGLSKRDMEPPPSFLIEQIVFKLDNFAALADRLRQGQLNTLVLARMMKNAVFNTNEAFQTPSGSGVFAGPEEEVFYFGASLGGIMGLMFSALSPDVTNAAIDVGAINFSFLLQRATPFLQFDLALKLTGLTDPMETALGISMLEELWVRGESAGYATHITSNPLPGTNAKNILMTVAWLDQQVSNQATEIAARTLGLTNLEGSFLSGLPQIPDRPGPLSSALVVYDTGSFALDNPEHERFIPPLANLQPTPNACDPHGRRGFIPASVAQLLEFLQPGGRIENFCDGICDAGDPAEMPFGDSAPCDPLAQ